SHSRSLGPHPERRGHLPGSFRMSQKGVPARGPRSRFGANLRLSPTQERIKDVVESFSDEGEGRRQDEDEEPRKKGRPPRGVKALPVQADVEPPVGNAARKAQR